MEYRGSDITSPGWIYGVTVVTAESLRHLDFGPAREDRSYCLPPLA